MRTEQVFVTVYCPICGDDFEINHSRWFLPCKNVIRCVCKTEYLVELTLAENKLDAVATITEVDTANTVKNVKFAKKRAATG